MKTLLKVFLTLVVAYVMIGAGWISKDMIIHEMNKDGIPVLGYHGVVSDKEKKKDYASNQYFMSESEFETQMKYLYDNHYECLFLDDVYDYYYNHKSVSKKCVCLTFDDGYKNFNTVIKPILEKYYLKATCFVIGNKVKKKNPLYLHEKDLLNDQYVEYYSHSYDLHHIGHKPMKKKVQTLSVEEIKKDFDSNKGIVSTDYFAFPYGISCKNAQTYLESSHVKLAFGYNENRTLVRSDNPYLLPRYLVFSNMPMRIFKWWIE